MNIAEYLAALDIQLQEMEGVIISCAIERRIDTNLNIGFIKGRVEFIDGSQFEFSEQLPVVRRKFRFQYMDAQNILIARWDSAPHHRMLKTFPFHQHTPQGVCDSPAMTLVAALEAIAVTLTQPHQS